MDTLALRACVCVRQRASRFECSNSHIKRSSYTYYCLYGRTCGYTTKREQINKMDLTNGIFYHLFRICRACLFGIEQFFESKKKKQRGRSKCIGICRMNKNSKWEAAENLFCSRYRHDSHVYFAFWFFVYTF